MKQLPSPRSSENAAGLEPEPEDGPPSYTLVDEEPQSPIGTRPHTMISMSTMTRGSSTYRPVPFGIDTSVTRTTAEAFLRSPTDPRISPDRRISAFPMSPNSPISSSFQSNSNRLSISRMPMDPIIYTFTPQSFDSMVLAPPAGPSSGPVYHISVRANCFSPSFWITTIRRGGSEDGEYVGEFEMGYSKAKPSTACIRGREYKMKDIFKAGVWDNSWILPERSLLWDKTVRKGISFTCTTLDRTVLFAKFFPATELREPGQAATLTSLVVFPAGQEPFDDILMSALVIERLRTGGTLA